MRNAILTIIFILSLALALGGNMYLLAADANVVRTEKNNSINQIALACQLVFEGRSIQSPLVLASAAEIFSNIATKEARLNKTSDSGGANTEVNEPVATAPANSLNFDAKALYAEAAYLARFQNNESLALIIESIAQASSESFRNSAPWPIEHYDTVNPNSRDVYFQHFSGGVMLSIMIIADEGYDIDLQITDMNDTILCEDSDPTNLGLCEWTPPSTQEYKIKVVNTTDDPIDYLLYFFE